MEPAPAPGIDSVQEFALSDRGPDAQDGEYGGANPEDACPGGDSAAGGDGLGEYQTVTYDDGSTYTGQCLDGKRHGHGLWQSQTGQYEGAWKEDIQHGKGRQTWSDGRVYNGQFEEGKFAGHGRMVWHTQKGLLIYEGEYVDDLKHGAGKFVWADGRTYDGEWQRGKRHGRGMYMNSRCEQKIGYWVNDQFERWEKTEGIGGEVVEENPHRVTSGGAS